MEWDINGQENKIQSLIDKINERTIVPEDVRQEIDNLHVPQVPLWPEVASGHNLIGLGLPSPIVLVFHIEVEPQNDGSRVAGGVRHEILWPADGSWNNPAYRAVPVGSYLCSVSQHEDGWERYVFFRFAKEANQ